MSTINRIDQDWQIVLFTPDPNEDSPQIAASILPTQDTFGPQGVFQLNYRGDPTFQAGGLSLELWNANAFVSAVTHGTEILSTDGEVIVFTQRMNLYKGSLVFKISSGNSITWGQFGADDDDLIVYMSSGLTDLSQYSPDTTIANSGASFGAQRVNTMKMLQVRYYQDNLLLTTDATVRSVNLGH